MDDDAQYLSNAFNSLRTDEHENLIQEFLNKAHSFAKTTINKDTAKFYLEASNWCVATAVSQFYENGNQKSRQFDLSSTFIKDSTIGEGENIPPRTTFSKSWKIKNDGCSQWPNSHLYLKHVQGNKFGAPRYLKMPSLRPGEEYEFSVEMVSSH